MEMKSPPQCPPTVTTRRNPHRKARPTPSFAIRLREPLDPPSVIRSFPIDDILSDELSVNPENPIKDKADPSPKTLEENLKVYLRIRPLAVQKHRANTEIIADSRNVWPKNPKARNNKVSNAKKKETEPCVQVNEDLRSVTVSTPQALQETKRIKAEVYEGFSHVFSSEASQNDVYEEMVKPLVEGFLKGKSGMLAALGPTGSGKTHTVFGSARQPGMVPLAFRQIFSESGSSDNPTTREFYLSMFEICSEKGKAEKMTNLLHDGSEMCLQRWALKGLQEVRVCDAQQAESLVACGMLKRSTASTNSNSQSSRSQCIIIIRSAPKESAGEVDSKPSSTMLTVVDLAGAERERKTGNQGVRLVESNFINNTSMVFGLCLRALLDHQKNPIKSLQKHYQNSLLTRYLRDYLEGKKRMMEFYLSMFEICSEKGKAEKMTNLLHDGSEMCLQRWALKGLQEVRVCDAQQAESLVACGMLKRSTASTNSNSQSSRSQCIINIRSAPKESAGEVDSKPSSTMLTVVDLAGAERERKTGNQGVRLVESNFINNTSMVFGLCLRALLDHQKNPIKSLQKHYQNSLLTRYLRDYLEGKKRMMLILTVRPGMEDYLDTSFLLRQASPFTKIKFKNLKEPEVMRSKRPNQGWPRAERLKKAKINEGNIDRDIPPNTQEIAENLAIDGCNPRVEDIDNEDLVEIQVLSDISVGLELGEKSLVASKSKNDKDREYQILLGLSKALWTVLKQYKKRVEGLEIENLHLRDSLRSEANSVVSSFNLKELDQTEDVKKTDPSGSNSSVTFPSRYGGVEEHYHLLEDLSESTNDGHEVKCLTDASTLDMNLRNEDFSTSIVNAQDLNCSEGLSTADVGPSSEATGQLGDSLQPSTEEDQNSSDVVPSHICHASKYMRMDGNSLEAEEEKLDNKEGKAQSHSLVLTLPKEEYDVKNTSKTMPELESCKHPPTEKPKRRLLPASSVLLKDISLLDVNVKDENEGQKGARRSKIPPMAAKNITQGSLSLLHLLTNKLNQ